MQRFFRSFIKNGKERKIVPFFWKERMPNPAGDLLFLLEPWGDFFGESDTNKTGFTILNVQTIGWYKVTFLRTEKAGYMEATISNFESEQLSVSLWDEENLYF